MSLFGTSPTEERAPSTPTKSRTGRGAGGGLFDDDDAHAHAHASPSRGGGLFADDHPSTNEGNGADSPWDMPTPRKQQSRAELIRKLLPTADVPETYVETFDAVVRADGDESGRITTAGIAHVFATARVDADAQARIMSLLAPDGHTSDMKLGRGEFNVLLALVGLAQEGDVISLDAVDERRTSKS